MSSKKSFVAVSSMSKAQESVAGRKIVELTCALKQACHAFKNLRNSYVPIDKKGNVTHVGTFMSDYGCPFNKSGNITDKAVQSACASEMKLVEGNYIHMSIFKNQRVCLISDAHEKLFVKNEKGEYVAAYVYALKEVGAKEWNTGRIMTLLKQSYHVAEELEKSENSIADFKAQSAFYRKVVDGEKVEYIAVKPERVQY